MEGATVGGRCGPGDSDEGYDDRGGEGGAECDGEERGVYPALPGLFRVLLISDDSKQKGDGEGDGEGVDAEEGDGLPGGW